MKVLLAIDDSKFSEAATHALIAQAKPKETEVRVLHVIEPVVIAGEGGFIVDSEIMTQELRKKGAVLLTQTAEALRAAGFQVATDLEEGDPKSVISDFAAKWPSDLVIMGSHGRKVRHESNVTSLAVHRHGCRKSQLDQRPIPPALLSRWQSKQNRAYGIENFQAVYGQVAEICFIAVTFM